MVKEQGTSLFSGQDSGRRSTRYLDGDKEDLSTNEHRIGVMKDGE